MVRAKTLKTVKIDEGSVALEKREVEVGEKSEALVWVKK